MGSFGCPSRVVALNSAARLPMTGVGMSVESALQRVGALQQALADPSAMLAAARTGGTAAPAAPVQEAGEEASGSSSTFAEQLQSASAGYAQPSAAGASASGATATPYAATSAYAPSTAGASAAGGYASAAMPSATSPYAAGTTALGSSVPGALGASAGEHVAAIAQTQVGQSEQPPGSNEGPAIAEYRSATAGAAPGEPWCAYFASWAARQAGVPLGANGEGLGSVSEIWSWAQSTGRAIANGPGVTPQPGDLIVFGSEHVGIVKDVLPNGQIQTIEGNYENKVAENVRSPTEATGYVQFG